MQATGTGLQVTDHVLAAGYKSPYLAQSKVCEFAGKLQAEGAGE